MEFPGIRDRDDESSMSKTWTNAPSDELDLEAHGLRPSPDEWRESRLCEACSEFPHRELWGHGCNTTKGHTHTFTRRLKDFAPSTCPLCALMVGEITDSGSFGWRDEKEIECEIVANPWVPNNSLPRGQVLPGREIQFAYGPPGPFPTRGTHIVTALETPAHKYLARRRGLEGAFHPLRLREWTSTCDDGHDHPAEPDALASLNPIISWSQLRVVDVVSGTLVTLTKPERYFAVSYVWGRPMSRYAAYSATPHDIGNLGPLDWSYVPRTVRDAAEVVRKVGERYLWVDALCIVQNDVRDKEAIIANMAAIYENAYVTIIAADGNDAEAGLSRLRDDPSLTEKAVVLPVGTDHVALWPPRQPLGEAVGLSTWNRRAWTFQEQLLSRRCAIFTQGEVFFTCGFLTCCETMDLLPQAHNPDGLYTRQSSQWSSPAAPPAKRYGLHLIVINHRTSSFAGWCEAVRLYTQPLLTHQGDRLDGFAGVAAKFVYGDAVLGDQKDALRSALCGHPELYMWHSLLWEVQRGGDISRLPRNAHGNRAFPTWSWAGWTGGVLFPAASQVADETERYRVVVLDETNIVMEPVEDGGFWERWPMRPERCAPPAIESFELVTLHLWAKVISCRLERIGDGGQPADWLIYSVTAPGAEVLLETRASFMAAHLGTTKSVLLDMLLFPGYFGVSSGEILLGGHGSSEYRRCGHGILIRRIDNTVRAERVDPSLVLLEQDDWSVVEKAARSCYIRLQ